MKKLWILLFALAFTVGLISPAVPTDVYAQTREATVFVTKPGKYSLIFTDYENEKLENVNLVEYDFAEGINVVPQEVASFTLENSDKIMLWYDMINLVPVCESLISE